MTWNRVAPCSRPTERSALTVAGGISTLCTKPRFVGSEGRGWSTGSSRVGTPASCPFQ